MQLVLPVKKGKAHTELSSGQTGFSPDVKTFLAICDPWRPFHIMHQQNTQTGGDNSSTNSLWQPMCHRTRISVPPCQGGAKKVSLWQATLNIVRSTPSALPK